MIGKQILHYKVLEELGRGGMGVVYKAEDTKLKRLVAIKFLPRQISASDEERERFKIEAQAAAALNHPNIATIYAIEEIDGDMFIVMEFIEGKELKQLIIDNSQLPIDNCLAYAAQIASGLQAAHAKGITHRDIKSGNIMVTESGQVKIMDFGLAKIAGGGAHLTKSGTTLGTAAYMSPEQARGEIVDHSTDIWSFGVVLYEILAGELPFRGEYEAALMYSIVHEEPEPFKLELPAALDALIQRMLEKEASQRPTAGEVAQELHEMERHGMGDTLPVPTATSASARADEGFWVAVLPFKWRGANAELEALAEGLSEDIVTGLSRFSYLRVIARSSTLRYASDSGDVRTIGKEIGARYVMEGSLRQAGTKLRLAVQLVDATTGAHLWAENYERAFHPEALFELQDDLVPRIVSTCADHFGVLARSISDAVRWKGPGQLSPYEALMRGFGYHHRLTPSEHAEAREALERAVEQAPGNADCWAMLSWIYSHEYGHGFNVRPDSLDRALAAARRAVELAPSNPLAYQTLAVALFFRKETAGCLSAAKRAMALNPLDASNEAIFLITFTGDWERGCALIRRAMELNPHHPGWYQLMFSMDEYRKMNYRAAVDTTIKANIPGVFWSNIILSAAYGQLGEHEAARNALRDLLAQKPDFAVAPEEALGKWFQAELVEHFLDGLRKAGLDVGDDVETGPAANKKRRVKQEKHTKQTKGKK